MSTSRYLKLMILLLFAASQSFAGRRILVAQIDSVSKDYIEVHEGKDTLYGFYYGSVLRNQERKVYYKAPLIIESFSEQKVEFTLGDCVASFQEINPYTSDSVTFIDAESIYACSSRHYDYWGGFKNGELVIRRQMIFGGSAFERMIFTELQ